MKQGIYLGPPPASSSFPVMAMLVAAAAGALVLAFLYQRSRTAADSLAAEVASLSASLTESSPAPSADRARLVAARLRLALESGAPDTVAATALLRLVESALPQGVVLEHLLFNARPQQVLTLEATAPGGDRVTELQRRLSSSHLVSATSILEERRLSDGRLAIRIQVGLKRQ